MQSTERQDCDAYAKEWKKLCSLAVIHYGENIFEEFLSHCFFEKIINSTAIIKAPTRFIKEHIESAYKKKLELIWQQLNENVRKIDVIVGRNSEPFNNNKINTAQIIQLPLWPDTTRAIPNDILRTALFAAIAPRNRKALEREVIAKEKDVKIIFTGWQLDQSDRDVWEQALHMARQQPLGTDIYFTTRGFLKALGRGNGKSQYEWLKNSFARLLSCGVEITHTNYTYAGSLLEFEREEDTQRYKLSINPKIRKLYDSGWTQADFKERQKVGNKKFLALWLHGYIASHAQIYPMKIETFYRLSGSKNSSMRDFKRQLLKALDHLKEVCLIKDYLINKTLIHIEKNPSNSQRRYLESI